jgi:hypothetical protein
LTHFSLWRDGTRAVARLKLTDDQLSHLFVAAQPLERGVRDDFLSAVADILGRLPDPGAHRAIVEAQRKFFDPPLDTSGLHTPKPRRDSLRRLQALK